jgi:serine/threonine-protein kinase
MAPKKASPENSPPRRTEDLSFARIAVKLGFLADQDVEKEFQRQHRQREKGLPLRPLSDLLEEAGLLDVAAVRKIYLEQGKEEGFPRIQGYRIEAKLGAGGMGTVYKARQESLDRPVAIKVLDPLLSRDHKFITRFLREARSVAMLNHENIIVGIDVGKTKAGTYFFIMEYVEGETVYEIMLREGVFPEARALEITLQIARALEHASRHGLVHRDVKPDNILITPREVAKLVDLGLAKSTLPDRRLTQAGSTHGTPHYMSPEQARGRDDVDVRSDIYSLGATLYHMLVGDVPFDGPSAAVILLKHISDELPPVRRYRPETSTSVQELIQRMMAKKPQHRYQTPADLIEDLEQILEGGRPRTWIAPPEEGPDKAPPFGSEDATQAFSREMRFAIRSPDTYLFYGAAAAAVLALAGLFGTDALSALGGAKEPASPTSPDPTPAPRLPVPSVHEREEKLAEENLAYVLRWMKDNPLRRNAHVVRLMESVVYRYRGTRAAMKALDRVEEVCSHLDVEAVDAWKALSKDRTQWRRNNEYGRITAEVEKIIEKAAAVGRFELWDMAPGLWELAKQRKNLSMDARDAEDRLEKEADSREAAQDPAGAAVIWGKIARLGTGRDVAEKVASLLELARHQKETAGRQKEERTRRKYLVGFLALLAVDVSSRDYDLALARCDRAEKEEDFVLRQDTLGHVRAAVVTCNDIWSRAVARLDKIKKTPANVILFVRTDKGHRVVEGEARDTGPNRVAIYRLDLLIEEVAYRDLAAVELLKRAGMAPPGLSGRDLASRALFLAFEGDFTQAAKELNTAQRLGEVVEESAALLADLQCAVSESRAGRLFALGEEHLAAKRWKEAIRALRELTESFCETSLYQSRESEVLRMKRQANQKLYGKPDPTKMFSAPVVILGGDRVLVTYDMAMLRQNIGALMRDWEIQGERAPLAIEGDTLVLGGGTGIAWQGRFKKSLELDVKMTVREVSPSVCFCTIESHDGSRIYTIEVDGGSGRNRIMARIQGPGGLRVETVAEVRGGPALVPGQEVTVSVTLKSGFLGFSLDGKPACRGPVEDVLMGRLVLWGNPSPLALALVRMKCKLD